MNPQDRRVREAPLPVPMEGLHDQGLPPFLNKTYEFVDDPETNHVVSWTSGNNSFVVWDPQAFALSLLPKYFKHRNFSSFVRQLNTYGFRKVDTDRWEFAHEGFLKGQKHLLKNIRRRNATDHLPHASQRALESCIKVGRFGSLDFEVDQLRRDKDVLMEELERLKQEQHTTTVQLLGMEDRLKRAEMKQQQMMNFLARAMRNPNFLQQLVKQKDRKKQLEEAITKKRRRSIEGPGSVEVGEINQVGGETFVKVEREHFGDISELEVPKLDKFAIDMQEISGDQSVHGGDECVENKEEHETRGKDMGESFWKQLLNDVVDEDTQVLDGQEEDEEDLCVLIEQLDSLVPRLNSF